MGYLVPNSKLQIKYVMENELSGAFTSPEMADAMKELANAYYENQEDFDKNANKYFKTLENVLDAYNIQQDDQENIRFSKSENIFPLEQRGQENFRETFHKLWKSISLAENLKKNSYKGVTPEADVAKIYQNYIPAYDEILKEKDMHDGIDRYFGVKARNLSEKRPDALRNLILIGSKYKNGESFSQEDLRYIRNAADTLNGSFSKYTVRTCTDPGLFSSDKIKTPEDLQTYIGKYETMLRDRLNKNGVDFYIFAQGYVLDNEQGDTTEKLTDDDIKDINSKLDEVLEKEELKAHQQEITEELKPFLQELGDLQDIEKGQKYLDEVLNEYNSTVNKGYQDVQGIKENPEIKKAQEDYDKEIAAAEKELEDTRKYLSGKKKLPYNTLWRHNDQYIDQNGKFSAAFDASVKYCEAIKESDSKKFDEGLKKGLTDYDKKTVKAQNSFTSALRQQMFTDIPAYRKGVQDSLKAIEEKRKTLISNPNDPKYQEKEEELKNQIDALKTDLEVHISAYKKERSDNYTTLMKSVEPFQKEMNKSCEKEKTYLLNRLNSNTTFLHDQREEFKKAYEKTEQGRRVAAKAAENAAKAAENAAKARQNLNNQLKDICEAMDSVKKLSVWGNSSQYNDMLKAIKDYREGKINANAAYDACRDYLKLSLNDNGGLDHMKSKAGQIRKQSCVRMLELLETAPDFKKTDKDKDGLAQENEKAKEVHKDKLNYETLKTSLANKSDAVTVNVGAKDAKAYSNLNAKISEIKNARKEAAKKAPVKEIANKELKAPVKGK